MLFGQWGESSAQADPRLAPCWAKSQFESMPISGDTPIALVAGHTFRKKDTCLPITVRARWKNEKTQNALNWWKSEYIHIFSGEIWLREDTREIVVSASALTYKGTDQVISPSGSGSRCVDAHCRTVYHYNAAYSKPIELMGPSAHGTSVLWSAPTVINEGEEVPEMIDLGMTDLHLTGSEDVSAPAPRLNNLALSPFKYEKFLEAIQKKQSLYQVIDYNGNADTEDLSDKNRGKVELVFYFGCPTGLKITPPENAERMIFDSGRHLTIDAIASLQNFPDEELVHGSAVQIKWHAPEKEGSFQHIELSPGGVSATIDYFGLPKSNLSFGPTVITARAEVPGCGTYEDQMTIKAFYPRDEKSNPSGTVPNWYYYWSQTSANKNAVHEYIEVCEVPVVGKVYHRSEKKEVQGKWYRRMLPKSFVCDFNSGPLPHQYPRMKSGSPYLNIDVFAVRLLASQFTWEFWETHWNRHFGWPHDITLDPPNLKDSDIDYIPDYLEASLGFDPGFSNTFNIVVGGDPLRDSTVHHNLKAEQGWTEGAANHEDWACPGNQCF